MEMSYPAWVQDYFRFLECRWAIPSFTLEAEEESITTKLHDVEERLAKLERRS